MGKKIYRFRRCNDLSFQSLLRCQVYASTPDLFNDPYDGKFSYDPDLVIRFLQSEGLYEEFVDAYASTRDDPLHAISALCSIEETEWRKRCLIACFSEECTKEMMWAHYGDGGTGFAIVYDSDDILSALGAKQRKSGFGLHKVKYLSSRTDFSIYICRLLSLKLSGRRETDNSYWVKHYASLFLEKNICWREEKEWRIILANDGENSNSIPILRVKPAGIILGENVSRTSRYVLCSIANHLSIAVSEMEQYMHKNRLEYAEKPISQEEIKHFIANLGASLVDLYGDILAEM